MSKALTRYGVGRASDEWRPRRLLQMQSTWSLGEHLPQQLRGVAPCGALNYRRGYLWHKAYNMWSTFSMVHKRGAHMSQLYNTWNRIGTELSSIPFVVIQCGPPHLCKCHNRQRNATAC